MTVFPRQRRRGSIFARHILLTLCGALLLGCLLASWGGNCLQAFTAVGPHWPDVSVQVVTYGRPHHLVEALQQIAAQDYPGRIEVVVVDDSPDTAAEHIAPVAANMDVKYLYLEDRRYTIGEKRNIAVDATDSEVMCIWDDDDIFPVDRIRQQVSRMMARGSPCSSIGIRWVYSVEDKLLSRCLGLPYPLENTFTFRKDWLSETRRFRHTNFAYMEHLFDDSTNWYAEAQPISGEELPFLYVRIASPTASLMPGGREFCVAAVEKSLFMNPAASSERMQLDSEFLTLARAVVQGRFPSLSTSRKAATAVSGWDVLQQLRSVVKASVQADASRLHEDEALRDRVAALYASRLGVGTDAAQGNWNQFGPAGEQPEASLQQQSAMYAAPDLVDAAAVHDIFDATAMSGGLSVSPDVAMQLIDKAVSDL